MHRAGNDAVADSCFFRQTATNNPTIFNLGHYHDDPDSSRAIGAWLDVRSP